MRTTEIINFLKSKLWVIAILFFIAIALFFLSIVWWPWLIVKILLSISLLLGVLLVAIPTIDSFINYKKEF